MKTIVSTLVFLVVFILQSSFSAKTTNKPDLAPKIKSEADAFKYLNKFGYNPCGNQANSPNAAPILCQSSMNTMLELFQKKYKLPVTGKLDKKTAQIMSAPRCGMQDDVFKKGAFKIANSWPKRDLTWKLVDKNLPSFGAAKTREEIRKSFDDWAKHAPIKFREVSENEQADFTLAFIDRTHPEGGGFDEKDITLAFAYFPPVGQVRFNTRQKWTTAYDGKGINLRIVTTHELGHALGLEHSSDETSIMYAIYKLMPSKNILPNDDRQGIQALYGAKNPVTTKTTSTKPPSIDRVWVPSSHGKVPLQAIVGGQENGRRVYVVRVSVSDKNFVPGKLIEGSLTAEAVLFGVRTSSTYEVLTHSDPNRKIKWIKTSGTNLPKGAILVGQSGTYQRYAGRIHQPSGSILLGKYILPDGVFYYQYQGKEVNVIDNFEVLCVS